MPVNINILADIRYLLAVDFAIPSIFPTDESLCVGMHIVYHCANFIIHLSTSELPKQIIKPPTLARQK
jgi:hypothetical protein